MNTNYFAHPTAAIDEGAIIGSGTRIWHFSHVMPGAILGDNCNLGQNVYVGSGVTLGSNVKVQNNVSLYDGVICEDDVFIGPSAVFTNVINPRSSIIRKSEYRKTIVRRGATIGANATIVCGYNIGEYAFIGAGAVVTKDVQAYSLVLGNPAKQVGWVSEHGNKLLFDKDNIAFCKESGQEYRLANNAVTRTK
jgi:UDP-2-acetamido-3-amino-2,3-dideoxy-glucuronate N-acetyltransferase